MADLKVLDFKKHDAQKKVSEWLREMISEVEKAEENYTVRVVLVMDLHNAETSGLRTLGYPIDNAMDLAGLLAYALGTVTKDAPR